MLRRARPLLGCLVEISAEGSGEALAHQLIDEAFAEMESVHQRMSRQSPDSDVLRINRAAPGQVLTVHEHTMSVIRESKRMAQLTGGAFCPFRAQSDSHCMQDVQILSDKHVQCRNSIELDFDGIAKGYAVDRAIDILRKGGLHQAMVNAGGDLRTFGDRDEIVWIRDPRQPECAAAKVTLCNEALASSAAYGQAGAPSPLPAAACWQGSWNVSVIAPLAMHADALTKVVLLMPESCARKILDQHNAQSLCLGQLPEQARAA